MKAVLAGTVIAEADQDDQAWGYPNPYPTAFERLGKDISGHIAFGPEVVVGS